MLDGEGGPTPAGVCMRGRGPSDGAARSWRRYLAVATAVAVLLPAAVAVDPGLSTGAAHAASPSCGEAAASEAQALASAAACNAPIVVGPSRSEYTQVVAQPDGHLSFESAVVPQRARQVDGSWRDVDLTLHVADGAVTPTVSVADVAFSGGGAGPMVTLRRNGKVLRLSWPGALPAPVLSGDGATYPNVFPDVDLVLHATPTGFTHVLVVKSAAAATNPALRKIVFGVDGDAELARNSNGSLQATAGTVVVARAEPARMWDSSAPAAGGSLAAHSSTLVSGDGALTGEVTTNVTEAGDLEIVPDPVLLTSTEVTFPLFIDPAWSVAESKWAYATSNGCTNTDYTMARVGLSPEGPCVGAKFRSYFTFPTTNGTVSLAGKHIESAYVQMKLYHSH